MRIVAIAIAILVLLWAGNLTYVFWVRPIDQPTIELREIEAHFNNLGVIGFIYPVRNGFSHSRVQAVAAFKIRNYPVPFLLIACSSAPEAIARAAHNPSLPQDLQPARNGKIVLDFSTWGNDTFPVAQSVRRTFLTYRARSSGM